MMLKPEKFESAADALSHLYKQCGTWPKTAAYLGDIVTGAFLWQIVNDGAVSDKVHDALAKKGYLDPRPHYAPAPVCDVCGELHGMKATCPSQMRRDPRRRRAWAGTQAEAEKLDAKLEEMGYGSLREYVDDRIL